MSLREVADGHRTGEGDMIGMRLFSKTEQLPIMAAIDFSKVKYRSISRNFTGLSRMSLR
jgi:hypothetical protein